MSTLHQLREGLTQALDIIAGGWHELVERAGDALTRFHPKYSGEGVERTLRAAAEGDATPVPHSGADVR